MGFNDFSAHPARSDASVDFTQAFALRAEAGERVVAAVDVFIRICGRICGRIWNRLARRSRERAAISALAGLESHTLKDIGVGRSEIRYLARETARRGTYDRSAARR